MDAAKPVIRCRVCTKNNLQVVLSLGKMPPANAFLKNDEMTKPEPSFPLELYFCNNCNFTQLGVSVSPELLYKNYVYVSSTSPSFIRHFEEFAEEASERLRLQKGDLVVDIGSNDGILLRPFQKKGMKVLGIDPAEKIAEQATKNGVETLPLFFSLETGKSISKKYGKAKLITAANVFSHVDDLDDFVGGIKALLADDGIFVFEVYYLPEVLKKNLFDIIYHEHLSYFTVKTISGLMKRLDMEVLTVKKTETHGGSIRVYCQKEAGKHMADDSVDRLIESEHKQGVFELGTYIEFAKKIEKNKKILAGILNKLKKDNKRICGYGAAAKANTLLNYFEIGPDTLDYIVDDSPWKQGLYTPGRHIPVVSADELNKSKPDYVLILAWNFVNQIMKKCNAIEKFILPAPRPTIITNIVEEDIALIADHLKSHVMSLEGTTVLITGGSGFLGSYMVATIDYLNRHIFKRPCKVISVDNHLIGTKNNLLKEINSDHIRFINHNVCNPLEIDGPVDYIISAAGVASPVYYKQYPIQTIEGTVFGIKNALELARKKNVKSMLFFSSSEIYGDPSPNAIPTPETYKGNVSCTGPRSCYDESKRIAETMANAYRQMYNVPVKIVRPFNVFGPGMKGSDYRVIPRFLHEALSGKPLPVHDKGNQTRTFCYVTDAVNGFFRVLLEGKNGEAYNIGNDANEINMLGLAHLINESIFDNQAKVNLVDYPNTYPQDEPRRRCPDLTKIKNELNYRPLIDLKTGLTRLYVWMIVAEFT